MQVWTINLPYVDDSHDHFEVPQAFEQFVVDCAGGFTRTFAYGAWRAPNGKVISEPINVYSIAVVDREIFKRIVLKAQSLYPNEQALYITGPDGAHIINNQRA